MSNQDKITALYCCLSKDDLNVGDSDSIVHQRAILEKTLKKIIFQTFACSLMTVTQALALNVPAFRRCTSKVGIVITKDLSRLGRNYIEVGNFTEFIFPRYGVRYIAINDNYDSLFSDNNELAPFKNLFNEWYARDTSKKIRSVFKAKAERGERLNDRIPYGYRPDPASGKKYSLLVNEETAPVVKLIYNLCAEGNGPNAIAAILKEKEIYKPSMYRYLHDGFLGKTDINDPYGWNGKTVGNILDNEVYLGHTVTWKSSVVSFKDKRKVKRPKEEQYRFENTHEPIISKETWDIVREVRGSKRRKTSMGEMSKFSGLVYCADCGCKHYFVRKRAWKPENYGFICSRYRKHLGEEICTPHKIREGVLDVIVLEEINKALYYARNNTKEFVDYISRKSSSQTRRELTAKTSELAKAEKRIKELKSLFKRLYEDNVLGRISDEQYRMLSADYNDEQKELESKLPELNQEIAALNNECTNVQRFLELAKKYTCITELTPDILRTLSARSLFTNVRSSTAKPLHSRLISTSATLETSQYHTAKK